jgi:hypothetical protein
MSFSCISFNQDSCDNVFAWYNQSAERFSLPIPLLMPFVACYEAFSSWRDLLIQHSGVIWIMVATFCHHLDHWFIPQTIAHLTAHLLIGHYHVSLDHTIVNQSSAIMIGVVQLMNNSWLLCCVSCWLNYSFIHTLIHHLLVHLIMHHSDVFMVDTNLIHASPILIGLHWLSHILWCARCSSCWSIGSLICLFEHVILHLLILYYRVFVEHTAQSSICRHH